MNLFVDIDGTICNSTAHETPGEPFYYESEPIKQNIDVINTLYDTGHYRITYYTARATGDEHITIMQFQKWGVKYHDLIHGKPVYDLFIDDRAITASQFFNRYYVSKGESNDEA